jgi:signal transduction histidine kinase
MSISTDLSHGEERDIGCALSTGECESVALLQGVLESIPAGLLIADEQLGVMAANRACLTALGRELPPNRRVLLSEILPPELLARTDLLQQLRAVLQSGQSSHTYRYVCRCDPEVPQIYNYRIIPFMHMATRARLLLIVENVTEQQRLESRLNHGTTMESLGLMAGSIVHELRNPLSIIGASAQLLLSEDELPYLTQECARRIDNATRRADRIIEQLLHFARPASEQCHHICNLNTIIEESMSLLTHKFLHSKIRLELALAGDLPRLRGNAQLLQQVFVNLANNAVQAMPDGGHLHIGTKQDSQSQLRATICDTGCGMDQAQQQQIFEPFFTTRPPGEGNGLGLLLCQRIIRQHGGQIKVQSSPGAGSSFEISLPSIGES